MSVEELQKIISPKFTEETLYEIVQTYRKLSDVKINKIDLGGSTKKGDSYLSHVFRFSLEATGKNLDGETENVTVPIIVKYFLTNIARRKTFRTIDFFENEAIFYKQVWAPLLEFQRSKNRAEIFDNIPLLLASDVNGNDDFIALQDVSPEGYTTTTRGAGLDRIHATEILRVLAGFHAVSLAIKDQQPDVFEKAATSLKETYFSERLRPWYSRFQEKLFEIVRDAVSKELPSEYLDKLNTFLDQEDFYGKVCRACESRGPLSAVTHGDVWAPNFLIRYKDNVPERTTVIDFQLTRYASLANDLTFFLYSCVDPNLVETDFDNFIEEYHKALVRGLTNLGSSDKLVSVEDIHQEIRKWNIFGVAMSMEAITMALLDDDDISDLDGIEGTEAVPLESVWLVHPFKEQEKRKRVAALIKFTVDRGFL